MKNNNSPGATVILASNLGYISGVLKALEHMGTISEQKTAIETALIKIEEIEKFIKQ